MNLKVIMLSQRSQVMISFIEKSKKCKLVYRDSMDKENAICIVGYYSAIREKEIPCFATMWMDLEGIMLSDVSHTEKVK